MDLSPSCSLTFLFELEKIRSIKRLIFTLTTHPRCHFRPVFPLHGNHPIEVLCKSSLYNDNTANLKHQFFHILFLTFLKTFFTLFPKYSISGGLFLKKITTRVQIEKLHNNTKAVTNNFIITRKLIELKFTSLQIY